MQGLREYSTDNPAKLRAELQRQNLLTERAFDDAARATLPRWKIVRVTGATYQASHGDFVLAGYNQNAKILLPRSSPETAGLSVCVSQVGGVGGTTAVAQSGQLVNNAAEYPVGLSTGYRELVDDGLGNFWGPADD